MSLEMWEHQVALKIHNKSELELRLQRIGHLCLIYLVILFVEHLDS